MPWACGPSWTQCNMRRTERLTPWRPWAVIFLLAGVSQVFRGPHVGIKVRQVRSAGSLAAHSAPGRYQAAAINLKRGRSNHEGLSGRLGRWNGIVWHVLRIPNPNIQIPNFKLQTPKAGAIVQPMKAMVEYEQTISERLIHRAMSKNSRGEGGASPISNAFSTAARRRCRSRSKGCRIRVRLPRSWRSRIFSFGTATITP